MIPGNIRRKHVFKAIEEINNSGLPKTRKSTKYDLEHNENTYPPKYVISLANKFANGTELLTSTFSGGIESNSFLTKLGFTITTLTRSRKNQKGKNKNSSQPSKCKNHSIHCSDCKNTIYEMLRKIYGQIKIEHKINIPTEIQKYEDTTYYMDLLNIYQTLINHRGRNDFVKSKRLQPCDVYIPSEDCIVELDESQHFSVLRKQALLRYPNHGKFGFSINHWIDLCNQKNSNNPVYRDEQRAWFDTLRDFYPLISGGKPTVRIYMGTYQWCNLDTNSREDVEWFKRTFMEKRKKTREAKDTPSVRIGTVTIESRVRFSNESRLKLLKKITKEVTGKIDLLLFPAGYFDAYYRPAQKLIPWLEVEIRNILKQLQSDLVVCIGVDGDNGADQLAVTCSKEGIQTVGRKFYPTKFETINPAQSYSSEEQGRNRILHIKGKKLYTAVCYDSFGIKHHNIPNPGVDGILNVVHQFQPKGQGNSGDVFFARHGFAGAARQWDCPIYGAAVFFDREVPYNWPTGVKWSLDKNHNTKHWKYKDNVYSNYGTIKIEDKEKAVIKAYEL